MTEQQAVTVVLEHAPLAVTDVGPGPDSCGAECVFVGRTRAETHETHGALSELSYEAHESLAVTTLRAIAEEARASFGVHSIEIRHALGVVQPGAASVLVRVFSRHREPSFASGRWVMDELKKRVPIWKREVWEDGTTWSQGTPVAAPERDA